VRDLPDAIDLHNDTNNKLYAAAFNAWMIPFSTTLADLVDSQSRLSLQAKFSHSPSPLSYSPFALPRRLRVGELSTSVFTLLSSLRFFLCTADGAEAGFALRV
jgi:hypothetical protein